MRKPLLAVAMGIMLNAFMGLDAATGFAANTGSSLKEAITVVSSAFDGTKQEFVAHPDHLAMATPHAPIKDILTQLKTRLKLDLINRGEAHVTVLTPPEFKILTPLVSMNDINEIAKRRQIQNAKLEGVCLGQGRAKVKGQESRTFFVIVRSLDLLAIRHEVRELFVSRGGATEAFNPDHFYPHITVGFTKFDLHEQNGIIKDERTCLYGLDIIR